MLFPSIRSSRARPNRAAEPPHTAQRPQRRAGIALSVLMICGLLGGCVIRQLAGEDPTLVYSYSSLDFSGKVWQRAQQQCRQRGHRVVHESTDCVVWLRCVSRFRCEP